MDTDLGLEYEDVEGTFVKLEDRNKDVFTGALRSAKAIECTDMQPSVKD